MGSRPTTGNNLSRQDSLYLDMRIEADMEWFSADHFTGEVDVHVVIDHHSSIEADEPCWSCKSKNPTKKIKSARNYRSPGHTVRIRPTSASAAEELGRF